ncbi:MAG: two-component system response regulator [Shackletoniella antarctica]|uniref:Two-component system response regulator n=1 Tax=Shackletoniella antarctica TaxID=268115 RepID=A0A2W4W033_9CYAN|nr:MAG: two-component system response regulator [Shackletoniella antarctica]
MTKRILIVDDEADIRDIVQAALEDLGGWQTLGAASGSEALRLAQQGAIDAILLDISMPDMDGFEIHQVLQQTPATQGIPVIVLTSKVLARDRTRFADLNVAGVITKPFNPLTLAQQIAELLRWSSPTPP